MLRKCESTSALDGEAQIQSPGTIQRSLILMIWLSAGEVASFHIIGSERVPYHNCVDVFNGRDPKSPDAVPQWHQ